MNRIVRYLTEIAFDRNRSIPALGLMPLLWLLSCCYWIAVVVKRGLYQAGILKIFRAPVPVFSVGNITAGGTGKTPFVVMLCRMLREEGFSPMVLTRGYMAGQGGLSDEAEMLKELIGLVVFTGADRVKSFTAAYHSRGFDCVILDDGFQQWGFARDLDIVLIDSEMPFGNGALIPRGILRESLGSLSRADMVVLTRSDRVPSKILAGLKSRVKGLTSRAVAAQGYHQVAGARDVFSGEKFALQDILGAAGAFCAIGSPESFRHSLEALGVDIKVFVPFFDHYRFTRGDAGKIVSECRALGLEKIFITHKDVMKVREIRDAFAGIKLIVIDIEFILNHGKTDIISSIRRLRRS